MSRITISAELHEDLQGIRREGEDLTHALARMARTLRDAGVVATGPGKTAQDAWRGGSVDTPVAD